MSLYEKKVEKVVCRLCESEESHVVGMTNKWFESHNTYELDKESKSLKGFAFTGENWAAFNIPVRYCPYCGKEL